MTDAPQLRRMNQLHLEDSKDFAASNGRAKAGGTGAGCPVERAEPDGPIGCPTKPTGLSLWLDSRATRL
jgi:hypothetical protein